MWNGSSCQITRYILILKHDELFSTFQASPDADGGGAGHLGASVPDWGQLKQRRDESEASDAA